MIKAEKPYFEQGRNSARELRPNEVKIMLELLSGSFTVNALCDQIGSKQPEISRCLASLRNRGLVSSDNDSDDRRIVYNTLTAAGRKYLKDLS